MFHVTRYFRQFTLSIGLSLLSATPALAHQPVMDMAPRWQQGYGFQIRQEYHSSDDLLSGNSDMDNPLGRDKSVNTTWLEGIYTFKREVRLTVKIPYMDQKRTVVRNGVPVQESGRGLGDIVIGVPLKRYTNKESATSNIAFTPSIRLPTGSTDGDFSPGDGSTDVGVSFSASWEKADLYQYYDLFYWKNGDGDNGIQEGNEIGFDANIGWHPYHNNLTNKGVFLMWDVSARYEKRGQDTAGITGGKRLSSGPVFVYYQGGMMIRAEYKYPFYEDVYGTQLSYGQEFNVGIGFVF
tara:strand:+ start:337 stop:1221 length:885 start_codon:yes stop_codon:yes gene_type:complete